MSGFVIKRVKKEDKHLDVFPSPQCTEVLWRCTTWRKCVCEVELPLLRKVKIHYMYIQTCMVIPYGEKLLRGKISRICRNLEPFTLVILLALYRRSHPIVQPRKYFC